MPGFHHDYSPASGPGSPMGKIPLYHDYDHEYGHSPSSHHNHSPSHHQNHPSHHHHPSYQQHPSHPHQPSHHGQHGQPQHHHHQSHSNPVRQVACVCCFVAVVALVLLSLSLLHIIGPPPAFDCQAGYAAWQSGWSDMKKEYCCENEGLGCTGANTLPDNGGEDGEHEKPPFWLDWWLADMSLGLKFLLSGMLAMLIGCCCGGWCYLQHLKREIAERRSQTEHELVHELTKTLARCGAKTGEISVTLMWDTKDDIDLHVKLPGKYGEISAENPEVSGGKLDIDGNLMLATSTTKPIENIYWPHYDHSSHHHPPIGEYTVYVKVYQKHTHHHHDVVNLTVVVAVQEHKDIYHVRMMPGCTELKVCSFYYHGPAAPHHDQHQRHAPRGGGGGGPDHGRR